MDLAIILPTLDESVLERKPNVAFGQSWHLSRMRSGQKDKEEQEKIALEKALSRCRSDSQRMFVRRVQEEMKSRGVSANAMERDAKELGLELSQVSVSRILRGQQDPTLEKINAIAQILGVPAWALLTDQHTVEQRVFRTPAAQNITKLPARYPGVFVAAGKKIRSFRRK